MTRMWQRLHEVVAAMQGVNREQGRPASRPRPPRNVDSPYLTVEEAAAYCRRKPKTLLNHHSLGNVRLVTGTRPLLFRREDLDAWLTKRTSHRR
ncbi:: HTH_17 [Gemmataceae bacterium]|nr:: HTH_17 [Gemmataceae bacterium]VTU00867.1 : HTH_17 [Gemmataceae bacterium]